MSGKPKLKPGIRATISRNNPVSLQATQKVSDAVVNGDRFQSLLNTAKAEVWQCSSEDERFKVAEKLLWNLIAVTHDIETKDMGIVWTVAADKIWHLYVQEHKLVAEVNGGEFYPSEYWVRHAFAKTIEASIRRRDPDIILGFRSRGWEHPALLLDPDKSKCFEWPDGTHWDTIAVPQVVEVPA